MRSHEQFNLNQNQVENEVKQEVILSPAKEGWLKKYGPKLRVAMLSVLGVAGTTYMASESISDARENYLKNDDAKEMKEMKDTQKGFMQNQEQSLKDQVNKIDNAQ